MTRARLARRDSDQRGLTLLELLFVLVVIAVGLLALSGVQTRSSTDVFKTGRETRALGLAQARMEAVRGGGFTLAVTDSGQADGFRWRTQVSNVSPDLKQIQVAVSWDEFGRTRAVSLDNLLSDR